MAYTSIDAANFARTSAVDAAMNEMATSGGALVAARSGALAAGQGAAAVSVGGQSSGGAVVGRAPVQYDAQGEPISPPRYFRAGDPVGLYPVKGGA